MAYPNTRLDDNSLMPFGKHKGQRMIDVPASWLLWYLQDGNPGNVKDYCKENEAALREEAAKSPGHGRSRSASKPSKPAGVSYSTPDVTNIYYKMFSSAFCLLNPGSQMAVKQYWADRGIQILGTNEDNLEVHMNQPVAPKATSIADDPKPYNPADDLPF